MEASRTWGPHSPFSEPLRWLQCRAWGKYVYVGLIIDARFYMMVFFQPADLPDSTLLETR
ncbi:hypothetical protein N656DRAFT_782439 [Canariomyces notabilis]|uniref:Uncharacterized protein n=1 Tax=Canariomyces notabilis TaxID=2074819 RepID=A0AAN6T9P3_9PEZI|nr:hypothetical protein N656DRAFT_782439 [Canariomyces arenarius]